MLILHEACTAIQESQQNEVSSREPWLRGENECITKLQLRPWFSCENEHERL